MTAVRSLRPFAVVLVLAGCGGSDLTLFDGKSLAGWQGDPRYWRVEDGQIVGTTDGFPPITQNTFLSHEGTWANFVLRLQFKIRNGNSGVQFRSEALPDYVVRGYQADVSDAADGHLGILYEERERGFLGEMMIAGVYQHVDLADWNDYEITADGPRIVLTINGFTTVSYTEADPNARRRGIVAVQVHVGAPMEVRYRNLRIAPR